MGGRRSPAWGLRGTVPQEVQHARLYQGPGWCWPVSRSGRLDVSGAAQEGGAVCLMVCTPSLYTARIMGQASLEEVSNSLTPPTSEAIRAIALANDKIRFDKPAMAMAQADLALKAWAQLPASKHQHQLSCLVWAVYASSCRLTGDFESAELALSVAARYARGAGARSDVAHRLSFLRADQGRGDEARALVTQFVALAREVGGSLVPRRLSAAGAILNRFDDFSQAIPCLEEALRTLPMQDFGQRWHVSAAYNLAYARLESEGDYSSLHDAAVLLDDVRRFIEVGTNVDLRFAWLSANLYRRLGRFDFALKMFDRARVGVEAGTDELDKALLLVDIAALHLERGAPKDARDLARSGFAVLRQLKNKPEAYRAFQVFFRAANDLELDASVLGAVRRQILAAR